MDMNYPKMVRPSHYFLVYILVLILLVVCKGISGATLTLINKCDHVVWPGILANAGSDKLDSTGFELSPRGSRTFQVPPKWSGRIWGRTGCTFDPNSGQGSCATGDCGSNQIECNGNGAIPPATLAEFTIQPDNQDFYDVSLVDGYNLPIMVDAKGRSGTCESTGCITDLNQRCPNELRVGSGDACKSACEAFGTPEYCCSGEFGTPDRCRPSTYSEMFKSACPRSYSYAYDDPTSTFTCTGADYTITFCPSSTSQKRGTSPTIDSPTVDTTGSGSREEPTGVDNSWLPDLVIGVGGSSESIPCFKLAIYAIFFCLTFLHILYF